MSSAKQQMSPKLLILSISTEKNASWKALLFVSSSNENCLLPCPFDVSCTDFTLTIWKDQLPFVKKCDSGKVYVIVGWHWRNIFDDCPSGKGERMRTVYSLEMMAGNEYWKQKKKGDEGFYIKTRWTNLWVSVSEHFMSWVLIRWRKYRSIVQLET